MWHSTQHRASDSCSACQVASRESHSKTQKQGMRTRLKATATGAPLFTASSAACSSAQLSRARWSRDILGRAFIASMVNCVAL